MDYGSQVKRGVFYRRYMLAGLTGPGQLLKGQYSIEEMVHLSEAADLEYLNKCKSLRPLSLFLFDLSIIFKTFQTLLAGEGLFD
jgi:lipopolysaccharide/colanic/teichoic acid biosynthesis glycosyltransferase